MADGTLMNPDTLAELKRSHAMFGKMVQDLIHDAGGPGFFWQIGVLAICLLIAWPLSRRVVQQE